MGSLLSTGCFLARPLSKKRATQARLREDLQSSQTDATSILLKPCKFAEKFDKCGAMVFLRKLFLGYCRSRTCTPPEVFGYLLVFRELDLADHYSCNRCKCNQGGTKYLCRQIFTKHLRQEAKYCCSVQLAGMCYNVLLVCGALSRRNPRVI